MKTTSSILIALAALASAPAFASNGKMSGGGACIPSNGIWTGSQPSSGRMYNGSNGTVSYTCPVIKDEVNFDLVDTTNKVHVIDNSTTGNASCTLYSRYTTTAGATGTWSASGSTSGNSSFTRTILLSGSLGSGTDSNTSAVWYWLACDIPASGYLVSYYWDENN
jgi:hypothetical protein